MTPMMLRTQQEARDDLIWPAHAAKDVNPLSQNYGTAQNQPGTPNDEPSWTDLLITAGIFIVAMLLVTWLLNLTLSPLIPSVIDLSQSLVSGENAY